MFKIIVWYLIIETILYCIGYINILKKFGFLKDVETDKECVARNKIINIILSTILIIELFFAQTYTSIKVLLWIYFGICIFIGMLGIFISILTQINIWVIASGKVSKSDFKRVLIMGIVMIVSNFIPFVLLFSL